MFQPMAWRSKPQVNRLQEALSSHQVEQHTIRRWPWSSRQVTNSWEEHQSIKEPRPGSPSAHLSVAPGESGQSHPRHVKQPDLPVVVREGDDFLVHRHADPGQPRRERSHHHQQPRSQQTGCKSSLKNSQSSRGEVSPHPPIKARSLKT